MVKYLKTRKGHFYKLLKNGKKKRISQREYRKKKTRKNIKMIGGEGGPIEESDIMYQDDLVCILKPEVKKGIIVLTNYVQPPNTESLCISGLKTGKQLHKEGIEFGRNIYHPYIFFKAPYYSREINYSTPETEIVSSYGEGQIEKSGRVYIRVDPDKTFVFSSEIRDVEKHPEWYGIIDNIIQNYKKTLSDYLKIINNNLLIEENVEDDKSIWYNLFTGEAVLFSSNYTGRSPFDRDPINYHSEILVSIPHLTPDYFVLCTPDREPISSITARPTSSITARPTTPTITSTSITSEPKGTYDVEVLRLRDEKVFKCPACGTISGTFAARNPTLTHLFKHHKDPNCPNQGKIPIEPSI